MSGIAETTFFPKEGTRKVKKKKKKKRSPATGLSKGGLQMALYLRIRGVESIFFSYLSRGFSFRKKLYSVVEFFLAFVLFLSHES